MGISLSHVRTPWFKVLFLCPLCDCSSLHLSDFPELSATASTLYFVVEAVLPVVGSFSGLLTWKWKISSYKSGNGWALGPPTPPSSQAPCSQIRFLPKTTKLGNYPVTHSLLSGLTAHVTKFTSQQHFMSLPLEAACNLPKWWMFIISRHLVCFSLQRLWATLTLHREMTETVPPQGLPQYPKTTYNFFSFFST